MKTFRRLLFLAVLVSLVLFRSEAQAQAPVEAPPDKIYTRDHHFILPLLLDDKERAVLQDVQLYVKNGANGVWLCKDTVPATKTGFDFRVPEDGEYWFTVTSIDKTGKLNPADTQHMTPGLIVVVDSKPPEVSLQTLPPSSRGALIECQVKDANPDPSKLKAEFQLADKNWQVLEPLPDNPNVFRLPGPALPDSVVRITATDRAGNTTTRPISLASTFAAETPLDRMPAPRPVESNSEKLVGPGLAAPSLITAAPGPVTTTSLIAAAPSPVMTAAPRSLLDAGSPPGIRQVGDMGLPPAPVPSADPIAVTAGQPVPDLGPGPAPRLTPDFGASAPPRQLVNATRVSLEYQIEQQGPTGVSQVEVFATRDNGMTWHSVHVDSHHSPVEFELPGEGLYGVSLVVTNGTGVSTPPPQRGDAPDYWVEVDLTRPAAQLISMNPGVGVESGTLHITWAATDKNLGSTPIDLYYTTKRGGPWEPIARGLRNEGNYRWALPKNAGPEFYVRMDVTDQAGNLTRCESAKPVLVDLIKPKARVLTITARTSRLTAPLGN